MNQLLEKTIDEVRGAWRFRWLALATVWAVCLVGWVAVLAMPNTYEANARVNVDSRSILRPLLQGLALNPDVGSELDLVRQVLLSRPHLEKVAKAAQLDTGVHTQQERDDLVASLQRRIVIEPSDQRARVSSEGLYHISFRDSSREKSLQVVQTLLNSFVEDTIGSKRIGQENAQHFLDEQIADHEKRLSEAEARLSAFKKKNVGLMPDQRGDYFARLQQESAGLEQARSALSLAESRRAEIAKQLAGEDPAYIATDPGPVGGAAGAAGAPGANAAARGGDLTYRIQDLEKKLDDLLLRYTDKHPEVIATRETLEELKKRQADELALIRARKPGTGALSASLTANPVYQNLMLEQKHTDIQVAEMREDVVQRQGRVAELKRLVNTVPEVEAELAQLNRDYDVTHGQYLELVKRRETANLSEDVDRSGTVKFDVIDPPIVGFKPVAPNRPLLITTVLFAALLAGAGLAYVLNQIRPVIQNTRTLGEVTGLPVLAAVSRTWASRHRERSRGDLVRLSAAAAAVLIAFAVMQAFYEPTVRLVQRLSG